VKVELVAAKLHILNNAKTPPSDRRRNQRGEETRLRSVISTCAGEPHQNLAPAPQDHPGNSQSHGRDVFLEVETPMLTRSDAGRRADYLVPSRVHHGAVFTRCRIPTNLQADPDDRRPRRLLPDRQVASATKICAPTPAGIHAARRRDVLSAAVRIFSRDRKSDGARLRRRGSRPKRRFRTCL